MAEDARSKTEHQIPGEILEKFLSLSAARVGAEEALRIAMRQTASAIEGIAREEDELWTRLFEELGIPRDEKGTWMVDRRTRTVRKTEEKARKTRPREDVERAIDGL